MDVGRVPHGKKCPAVVGRRFRRETRLSGMTTETGVKNPTYPSAVEALKTETVIPPRVVLRQCQYLNNAIERYHRSVKQRVCLAKGYGSFERAWRTLPGIEAVNTIRKGRVMSCPRTSRRNPSDQHEATASSTKNSETGASRQGVPVRHRARVLPESERG